MTGLTGGPNGISGIDKPTLFGLSFERRAAEGMQTFHEYFGLAYNSINKVIFLYLVALLLVLLPAGPERRRWELAAVAFAFVMALSRVYLQAHWFSDVVAGVLLGAGVALGSVGLVTEIRDIALRRRARAPTGTS